MCAHTATYLRAIRTYFCNSFSRTTTTLLPVAAVAAAGPEQEAEAEAVAEVEVVVVGVGSTETCEEREKERRFDRGEPASRGMSPNFTRETRQRSRFLRETRIEERGEQENKKHTHTHEHTAQEIKCP